MDYYISDFNVLNPDAIALEDSIMVKDSLTTAGSKILENFIAPFNATVVDRLQNSNKDISGKTRMKEFGISGIMENNQNSLSGSAEALNGNAVSCCLCNDLFGQYRREAAENNLCYIHPTYGTVSRYGLIPLAPSMDQIGVLCKDISQGFSVLSVIAGNDPKDGAMFPERNYTYTNTLKKIKIGIPSNIVNQTDIKTRAAINDFSKKFVNTEFNFDFFDVCKQTMYILSCAEISNNISRYDGIKFGYRSPDFIDLENLYIKTRTEALGIETKLAAIMGSMVLSAGQYQPYYEKAMKIRRLIKEALRFDSYDAIILPASMGSNLYENLSLYAIAVLAGLPSVSLSYNGCGIQLIANVKNENALLTAWEVVQQ